MKEKARFYAELAVAWFREHARSLPWRGDYAPYRTLVSEFMLQQTQVGTVIPYFERWMARWPDLPSLAAADDEEVLKLWEGLGYYSRCRNLLAAARAMVEAGHSAPPASVEALRAFPGIGDYTAGAIASVGYDLPVPAVDGNAERVISRLFALSKAGPALRREVAGLVTAMLAPSENASGPGVSARELNQALMDLGATVCVPRNPACGDCPWEKHCRAHQEGKEESFPVPKPHAPVSQDKAWGLLIFPVIGRELLLRRRPPKGLWAGMWELPWFPRASDSLEGFWQDLDGALTAKLFFKAPSLTEVGTVNFSYTTHRVQAWVVACRARPFKDKLPEDWRWASLEELAALTLPAPSRKFLAAMDGLVIV